MEKMQLLKRIISIAENCQDFEKLKSEDTHITITSLLHKSDVIEYIFNALEIPYKIYNPEINKKYDAPKETAVSFTQQTGLKVIQFVIAVLNEIYGEPFYVYIKYSSEIWVFRLSESVVGYVFIGTFLTAEDSYSTSGSTGAILSTDLLELNLHDMEWEEFSTKYPPYRRSDDYDVDSGVPSYDTYGGAYGFDDDAIDNAFEGDPENYWNVD